MVVVVKMCGLSSMRCFILVGVCKDFLFKEQRKDFLKAVRRVCSSVAFRGAVLSEYRGALKIKEFGKGERLESDQVRVQVDSAGVNHTDVLMVQGRYHLKPKIPFVPGFELAGEVVEVGKNVNKFRCGDRVLGLKTVGTGAFAERCICHEDELYPIPHSLDFEVAVSLPVAYGTAYLAFDKVAKIKENDKVLVLTSQGSTGMAAIDLALNVFRCKSVIAACESEEKCATVRPTGVLLTVEYTDENLAKNVLKATKGVGVDIVLDTVGGHWFDLALKCLRPGGHLCTVGFSSGQIPAVSLQDLIRYRATLSGIWLGGLALNKPSEFHSIIKRIIEFRDERFISPLAAKKFILDDVNEAIQAVDQKKFIGKIVLTVRK